MSLATAPKVRPGWWKVRKFVQARANDLCELQTPSCPPGVHVGCHAHHLVLRSQGGLDDPANLAWVCAAAHRFIHDHPALSFERGWIRRRVAS